MTTYTANEEDMKEYARIISTLAALDLQRDQALKALAAWEQAHQVPEDDTPSGEPQTEYGGIEYPCRAD